MDGMGTLMDSQLLDAQENQGKCFEKTGFSGCTVHIYLRMGSDPSFYDHGKGNGYATYDAWTVTDSQPGADRS